MTEIVIGWIFLVLEQCKGDTQFTGMIYHSGASFAGTCNFVHSLYIIMYCVPSINSIHCKNHDKNTNNN